MLPRFDADQYFAAGGPATVSPAQREAGNFPKKHESVHGVPVAIENRKGSTRIREDSGASKMAADYGQILREHGPDHDHKNTDTFVGPHKDSDRVFVVNQQHPHSGRFNEHKVLLGYNDRAHALRDYVHSFSDGLGHKRIQSVVEMHTHQLKDWLKKAHHDKPLKKAIGGPVTDPNDPNQWLKFGGQDMETAPAGLPVGQAVGTDVAYQTAEGLADAAKLAQEVQAGEVDPTSDEGIKRALGAAMVAQTGGVGGAPASGAVLGSGMVRRAAEGAAERELSPLGLYSHAAEVAEALPQAKGSPQQMKAMLKGVKQEELAGFDEAFAGQKSVTKDQIAQHFRDQMPVVEEKVLGQKMTPTEIARLEELDKKFSQQGGFTPEEKIEYNALYQKEGALANSQTKFSQYTLPGGENYREVLLKLPFTGKDHPLAGLSPHEATAQLFPGQFASQLTPDQRQVVMDAIYNKTPDKFMSSHWDDPNILAHLRMSDRTGPNGEKILHVEEIQSDWGQQGKKEGFDVGITPQQEKRMQDLTARVADLSTAEREELGDLLRASGKGGVPSAPYVTKTEGWTDLALKRALKEAAEGGYDKLVWTPGAEQAKRYSLSNQIESIHYNPATKELTTKKPGGQIPYHEVVEPGDIHKVIGKETADKLLAVQPTRIGFGQKAHILSGLDLELGGEGMKGYYDKIVPKRLQEIVKKHDSEAKIGQDAIPGSSARDISPPYNPIDLVDWHPEVRHLSDPQKDAWITSKSPAEKKELWNQYLEENGYPIRPDIIAPSLTITPKMQESILKGQTAFAEGGEVEAKPAGVPLTHYSRRPDLTEVDPAYYGTNNPGEDVARTMGRPDGNPRRSYFYVGQPGDVMPEHNLGEHAYTTTSDKLYDLSKDPLKVNRSTSPRDLNRMEQVIRAHGYEGVVGHDAAHPTAVLFEKKAVTRHPSTRTDAAHAASDRLAKQAVADFQDFHKRRGGDVRKSAFVLKNMKGADLDPQSAYDLAGHLVSGNTDAVRSAIMSHPGVGTGISKMFHKRSQDQVQ